MTGAAPEPQVPGRVSGRRWRAQEHRIELRGVSYRLRLVSFAAGWLASVDTVEGPTLGCDHSPYLAVSRAVEPLRRHHEITKITGPVISDQSRRGRGSTGTMNTRGRDA